MCAVLRSVMLASDHSSAPVVGFFSPVKLCQKVAKVQHQ